MELYFWIFFFIAAAITAIGWVVPLFYLLGVLLVMAAIAIIVFFGVALLAVSWPIILLWSIGYKIYRWYNKP
jgi:hypothetical protein